MYIQVLNIIFYVNIFSVIHLQIHRLHEYILGCDPGQYYNLTELHCEI